ncbi:BTAD domain-containing putative transcriptional regulator [Streptomyces sp. NPDC059740]|uniref:AfsR/SARP family transcriptional regulator n=1 Tax=Streptomyces sp. NPDC059740 TaxID=3346926 RepID=UPI0036544F5F
MLLRHQGEAAMGVGGNLTEVQSGDTGPRPAEGAGPDRTTRSAPEQVRFAILGPLTVTSGEQAVQPGGAIPSRVLGALLVEPRRVVPVHRLVAMVWDDDPPDTALHQIRKAVSILRGRLPGGGRLIVTANGGYRIDIEEHQLDASLFAIRLRRAGEAEAAGLLDNAVAEYRAALRLWRGPTLQGLGGAMMARATLALAELRVRATEKCLELRARLGESAALIGEIRALVEEQPLRESLRHQLILALYRSGRQAEALNEYATVRTLLAEELGITPGARLIALHEAVLRQSPELDLPATARNPAGSPPPVAAPRFDPPDCPPNTLPYDLADFTGRQEELRRLLDLVHADTGGGTRIVTVDGMGGAGKTALVVRVAHRLAEEYPDGQLYVDLRGHTLGFAPRTGGDVLAHLLRVMGVPGEGVPEDVRGRVALWRSITAQRRLLLVLDNAVSTEQIRHLIPGSTRALVLVTSRVRLVELAGATWLALGLLPEADAVELMRRTLGGERTDAEPAAMTELVRLCGRLPLALRIAAARLGRRPEWSIRHMVALLADEDRRMRELRSGEHSVSAALALSYDSMPAPLRTAFRLLAGHPGPSFSRMCAAALLALTPEQADEVLESLLDAHLLEQRTWERYDLHDLVRSFALSLPPDDDCGAEARRAGCERLMHYYVHAAERACDLLFPGRYEHGLSVPGPVRSPLPAFADPEEARAWFGTEHATLLAVLAAGRRAGLHRHTAVLARSLAFYLHSQVYYEDWRTVGQYAVAAARELDSPALLSVSLTNLAVAHWQCDEYRPAAEALEEALELAGRTGDPQREAVALSRLGIVRWSLGRFHDALGSYRAALTLHRRLGNERESAETLGNVCAVLTALGRGAAAVSTGVEAVALAGHIGDRMVEAFVLTELGHAHARNGEDGEAVRCLERALALAEAVQAPAKETAALLCLGEVRLDAGLTDEAQQCAERALELAQAQGTRNRRATAENLLGRVHLARGDAVSALAFHRRAHALAAAVELWPETARALAGSADALRALDRAEEAEVRQAEADRLFAVMGVPVEARPGVRVRVRV